MRKVSRFERFKQKMLGKWQDIAQGVLDELLTTDAFSGPEPFFIVQLECPPEMQKDCEHVNLSTGPVWVLPFNRKEFLSFLDGGAEDFINQAVADGADTFVAVSRNNEFVLTPLYSRPHAAVI